jgi:hypothetical protein
VEDVIEINSIQEFLELAKEEEMNEEEKVLREYIRKNKKKNLNFVKLFVNFLKKGIFLIFILIVQPLLTLLKMF